MTKIENNFDIPLLESDIVEVSKELKLYKKISLERHFEDTHQNNYFYL